MFHKLFEIIALYVDTINTKDQNTHKEAVALRREIESKQSPHTL